MQVQVVGVERKERGGEEEREGERVVREVRDGKIGREGGKRRRLTQ